MRWMTQKEMKEYIQKHITPRQDSTNTTRIPVEFLKVLMKEEPFMEDGDVRQWMTWGGNVVVAVKRQGDASLVPGDTSSSKTYNSFDFLFNPED